MTVAESQALRQARFNYRVRSLGRLRDYHPGYGTERTALTHREYLNLMDEATQEDAPKRWAEWEHQDAEDGIERTTVQKRRKDLR